VTVDFGKTARDYGRFRVGFPAPFFERLAERGLVRRGDRALDLGTGTGTVARGLALRGCDTIGLDPSESLMAEGRRLDREAGVRIAQVAALAEALPFAAASFDLVVAGQCWHWFDGPAAAAEARRALASGGHLAIAYFDWLPLPGTVVAATEALIKRHNPAWHMDGGTGIYPAYPEVVWAAGFRSIETFSFDLDIPYRHEAWRGRIRASAGVGASLPLKAVAEFDAEHAALLARDFPAEPLAVPHRVWTLVGKRP
jgi:SAM-dependent methyltransferase